MTLEQAWKEALHYGMSNHCSMELAISCVVEDGDVPQSLESALYERLSKERRSQAARR